VNVADARSFRSEPGSYLMFWDNQRGLILANAHSGATSLEGRDVSLQFQIVSCLEVVPVSEG
jgi:hypothetical protein